MEDLEPALGAVRTGARVGIKRRASRHGGNDTQRRGTCALFNLHDGQSACRCYKTPEGLVFLGETGNIAASLECRTSGYRKIEA